MDNFELSLNLGDRLFVTMQEISSVKESDDVTIYSNCNSVQVDAKTYISVDLKNKYVMIKESDIYLVLFITAIENDNVRTTYSLECFGQSGELKIKNIK